MKDIPARRLNILRGVRIGLAQTDESVLYRSLRPRQQLNRDIRLECTSASFEQKPSLPKQRTKMNQKKWKKIKEALACSAHSLWSRPLRLLMTRLVRRRRRLRPPKWCVNSCEKSRGAYFILRVPGMWAGTKRRSLYLTNSLWMLTCCRARAAILSVPLQGP